MIENIQLQIDAVLNPVISRQTIKRGRNLVVKLGDKEVDYHKSFKLYLQTKLSNPHYPPEIQAETTLARARGAITARPPRSAAAAAAERCARRPRPRVRRSTSW